MAKKSKRIRLKLKLSRLQEKLQSTGQLNLDRSNSDVIEEMKSSQPEQTIQPNIEEMVEELITTQVIEELPLQASIAKPMNLMKLKKAELLKMAESMNCNVSSKNTKSQIIAAIEKQSA